MTHQEREAIRTLIHNANVLMKGWLREREEGLARQRAADASLRGGWAESNQATQPDPDPDVNHD